MQLALEQQNKVMGSEMRSHIHDNFFFLESIKGRGAFFVYVGSIQGAIHWRKWASRAVGLFTVFVGFLYIKVGIGVSSKLTQLKVQLQSDEVIRRAFEKAVAKGGTADRDGDGRLDIDELKEVMKELGTTLSDKEAELALMQMSSFRKGEEEEEVENDGKIGLEEFRAFMVRKG